MNVGPQQGANGPSVSLWQRPAPWTEVVAASCSQPSPTTRGEFQPQNAPQIQQKKDQLQRSRACQREGSTSEKICWVGPHTYGAHRAAQKPHSAPQERCAMLAGVVWEGLPNRQNRRNLEVFKVHLATSPSRAVPKMANYRPVLIPSYRHCIFNDSDYSEAVKTIYSGRGPGRTTRSAAKIKPLRSRVQTRGAQRS